MWSSSPPTPVLARRRWSPPSPRPMEQSMSTLDRIKSVTSTSQDSVSMVVLEFEDGVNMDTVSVDIQQKINMLEGNWDDAAAPLMC